MGEPLPEDGPMFSSFHIKGHYDDGSPLTFGDDKPITLKLGDAEPETYWAKIKSVHTDGTVTYKLLPMERG